MAAITYDCKNVVLFNFMATPEILEKYLPAHTQLEYFNGHCVASLVGFQLENINIKETKIPFHTNFEQIGLQFYVKRFDGANWEKGTVFISQIANKPLFNAFASSFFKEDFVAMPTQSNFSQENNKLLMEYNWQFKNQKQFLKIAAENVSVLPKENSEEDFVLDREFIYSSYSTKKTYKYKILHPRWRVFPVIEKHIDVDFSMQFGSEFSHFTKPHSAVFAQGSFVSVEDHQLVES